MAGRNCVKIPEPNGPGFEGNTHTHTKRKSDFEPTLQGFGHADKREDRYSVNHKNEPFKIQKPKIRRSFKGSLSLKRVQPRVWAGGPIRVADISTIT